MLQTCSNFIEIATTFSLHLIRITKERGQVFEMFKSTKTTVFCTATFKNLNKFVLWSLFFFPEIFTTWQSYQISRACKGLEQLELARWVLKIEVHFCQIWNSNNYVLWTLTKWSEFLANLVKVGSTKLFEIQLWQNGF